MSYHVHDPMHTDTRIAFGNTFPTDDIDITPEFLSDWPALKVALDEIGLKLCQQYHGKTSGRGGKFTGINFVSLSFNLDLGPKR